MSGNNTVRVEIAGLCAEIDAGVCGISAQIHEDYNGYLSDEKPSLRVSIIPPRQLLRLPTLRFFSEEEPVISDVTITRANSHFVVSGRLILHRGTSIPMQAGTINVTGTDCLLYDHSSLMSQTLIVPFFRACLQYSLARSGGFLLHASGVSDEDGGYVFSGPSGCGKSTVASLSKGYSVLSDDIVCLRQIRETCYVYGTPWNRVHKKQRSPVKAIFFLKHAKITTFEKLTPAKAANELMVNMFNNIIDKEIQSVLLCTVADIMATIPCYIMRFSLNDSFWDKIHGLA